MFASRRLAGLLVVFATVGATLIPSPTVARAADGPEVPEVFAGTGIAGFSGDGGPAVKAELDHPAGVAVAGDGTVYLSDLYNRVVRAVSPAGTITTVAGTGRFGTLREPVPVPDGAQGTEFDLAAPASLAVGPDDTLYIADAGQFRVFALTPDGRLALVAGTGRRGRPRDGVRATDVALGHLAGLAVAPDGTVYLGDVDNYQVRAITPDGVISTVAGNGGARMTAAGGFATEIPVVYPISLAVDRQGTVWIDSGRAVCRLSEGRISTVVLSGAPDDGRWSLAEDDSWPPAQTPLYSISDLATGDDGLYLLNQRDKTVLRLGTGDDVEVVLSLGGMDNLATGPMAVGASGIAYVVDIGGNRVYAYRMPPATPEVLDEEDEESVPWRPFLAAGAVVIVLIGTSLVRRRRRAA